MVNIFSTILAQANCDTLQFSEECLNQIEEQGIRANNPYFVSSTNINDFFSGTFGITNLIFFLAAGAIGVYLISGGIGLMTSQGNPTSVAANKQKITNAFAGFLLLVSAYWIVQLVGRILGLEGITQTFTP